MKQRMYANKPFDVPQICSHGIKLNKKPHDKWCFFYNDFCSNIPKDWKACPKEAQ